MIGLVWNMKLFNLDKLAVYFVSEFKTLIFIMRIEFLYKVAFAFSMFLSSFVANAQNVIVADTVDADDLFSEKPVQIPLDECEYIDTCEQRRYAIVTKDGKKGIYDLERHENVTAIDLDFICYSRSLQLDDSLCLYYFYAEDGLQSGIIGVAGTNNSTLGFWNDNPRLVGNLAHCTTVDSIVSDTCRSLLLDCMLRLNGNYGQIAVIDAQTGHLKAWVALGRSNDGFEDAKLLKLSCTASMFRPMFAASLLADVGVSLDDSIDTGNGIYDAGDGLEIRDPGWHDGGYGVLTFGQALAFRSDIAVYSAVLAARGTDAPEIWKEIVNGKKETNAMEIASIVNSFYCKDKILYPSLEGDSLCVEPFSNMTVQALDNVKKVLDGFSLVVSKANETFDKSVDVGIAGLYGAYVSTDDKSSELSFAGCFPSDNPRYAVGLFIGQLPGQIVDPCLLSDTIEHLVTWLSK